MKIYTANWVLPIVSEPIEQGAVIVDAAHIVKIGRRAEVLAAFPDIKVEDFGEAAILPGFINCHAHLELTAMRGFLASEEGHFHAWLKKLTAARQNRMTEEDLYVSAACGVVEAIRAGVTCLGDSSSVGATAMKAMHDVGVRGIVYHEAFGIDPQVAVSQFEKLKDSLGQVKEQETELVRVGVSPHAPYTVSARLLELIAEYSIAERMPLMIHAAESIAENLLLLHGEGFFADGLRLRGIEWKTPGVSTIRYFESVGLLRARPLLAHCVHVDAEDISIIKERGAKVAHCPKSNSKFGHGRAPFAEIVTAGIHVGLGSDSVASNNTCDLLEEARFAMLTSRAGGDRLGNGEMIGKTESLRAATFGGARALGLAEHVGFLAEGTEADLVVVGLAGAHQQPIHDVATTLVDTSSGRDVVMTMVAGQELFRDGRVTTVDEQELLARLRITARGLYE